MTTRRFPLILAVVGVVLMLPEIYVYTTSSFVEAVPLPGPGLATKIEVNNRGFAAAFRDKFRLAEDIVVEPTVSVDMPQRSPVPCRLQLSKIDSNELKPIVVVNQLHHASDYEYAHIATFASDLFDMPVGVTSVSLTNLGCEKDYTFVGGVARIGPVGEHLLVPIGAMLLWWIGVVSLIIGFVLEFVRPGRDAAALPMDR